MYKNQGFGCESTLLQLLGGVLCHTVRRAAILYIICHCVWLPFHHVSVIYYSFIFFSLIYYSFHIIIRRHFYSPCRCDGRHHYWLFFLVSMAMTD